jgi:hypothetical protein
VEEISSLVTQGLEGIVVDSQRLEGIMVDVDSDGAISEDSEEYFESGLILSHKAIATLFPYATRLAQGGQPAMANAISLIARTFPLIFEWCHIGAHITAVFDESSPPSLNQVIALVWPYARQYQERGR